jgi:hypothetical protein
MPNGAISGTAGARGTADRAVDRGTAGTSGLVGAQEAARDRGTGAQQTNESRALSRVDAIVLKMLNSLDKGSGTVFARSALSHMRAADPPLTHDETLAILYELHNRRRVAEFLIVNGEPECGLSNYLS